MDAQCIVISKSRKSSFDHLDKKNQDKCFGPRRATKHLSWVSVLRRPSVLFCERVIRVCRTRFTAPSSDLLIAFSALDRLQRDAAEKHRQLCGIDLQRRLIACCARLLERAGFEAFVPDRQAVATGRAHLIFDFTAVSKKRVGDFEESTSRAFSASQEAFEAIVVGAASSFG